MGINKTFYPLYKVVIIRNISRTYKIIHNINVTNKNVLIFPSAKIVHLL